MSDAVPLWEGRVCWVASPGSILPLDNAGDKNSRRLLNRLIKADPLLNGRHLPCRFDPLNRFERPALSGLQGLKKHFRLTFTITGVSNAGIYNVSCKLNISPLKLQWVGTWVEQNT